MQNSDKIESELGKACNRAIISGDSRERILKNILSFVDSAAAIKPIWTTPSFWAIIAAIIILAIMVYGIWLPSRVSIDLLR